MASSRHDRGNDPRAVPNAAISATGPGSPATGPRHPAQPHDQLKLRGIAPEPEGGLRWLPRSYAVSVAVAGSAAEGGDDVVGLSSFTCCSVGLLCTKLIPMFREAGATRLLAISPHLDDAVLSLGAGLAQAAQDGAKVTVYTVFAGTAPPPYSAAAERMHSIWGLSPNDDAPLYRRKEDIAALNHLGVGYRHGRFLDAIYRKLPDGRWLAGHVAGGQKLAVPEQSSESNRELVSAIKDDIKSVIEECDPTLLATCAAIGSHPDHEMARDAALFAADETGVPIRLWEDLPYTATGSGTVELPQGFHLGSPDAGSVRAEMRTRKFQALEHYPSQLLMLNGRDKNLFAQLEEHARKISPHDGYGETTWPVIRCADNN